MTVFEACETVLNLTGEMVEVELVVLIVIIIAWHAARVKCFLTSLVHPAKTRQHVSGNMNV